jgi:hypothetical protein
MKVVELREINFIYCAYNYIIISGVRLGLLVLQPLLAYCTSPG